MAEQDEPKKSAAVQRGADQRVTEQPMSEKGAADRVGARRVAAGARGAKGAKGEGGWLTRRERGTVLGVTTAYWLATALGRAPTRWLVRVIALWYVLTRADVRRSSRQWLSRVFGRPARLREVYRHLVHFAQVTVDRMFLLRRKLSGITLHRTGDEHLRACAAEGQGIVLLGSHLGSFEALRVDGRNELALPINILGFFENARMINALLERLDPEMAARVIHIGQGSVDFIFQVQQAIERGEFVGTTGDRVGLNEKSVWVEFFGRPARFPTGALVLASVLKCPVYLTFGLYREPGHYDLYCEPFLDRVVLPRGDREATLQRLVEQYVRRLEDYCRQAPYNWFNFYDFWHGSPSDEQVSSSSRRGSAPEKLPATPEVSASTAVRAGGEH